MTLFLMSKYLNSAWEPCGILPFLRDESQVSFTSVVLVLYAKAEYSIRAAAQVIALSGSNFPLQLK